MATTTSVGRVAQDVVEIEAAQAAFDAHMANPVNGRCATCVEEAPCRGQVAAVRLLANHGRLPRRRPGATQPLRVGLRRISVPPMVGSRP